MSDTPRTDAERAKLSDGRAYTGRGAFVYMTDHAETLERELAEARKELGDRLTDLERAGGELAKCCNHTAHSLNCHCFNGVEQVHFHYCNIGNSIKALTAWQQLTKATA